MKKYCLVLLMTAGLCSCAGIQKKEKAPTYSEVQSRNLTTAKRLMQEKKVATATEILADICSAEGVPGVTDEALFRLALLHLDDEQAKRDAVQALHTLEKLMREYPESSWRNHSVAIIELIATQNRRIKSLKGENLSLMRENKELRLNIEKLKILDIEQELKGKR